MSRRFSGDHSTDRLHLRADDRELVADGADATWLVFGAVDKFGAPRSRVGGQITLKIKGPGQIIGDNPFDLAPGGGWGAVLVRTVAGRPGRMRIAASHPQLGHAEVAIDARNAE